MLALPAVGGKFGVRGGGYAMTNSKAWNIARSWVPGEEPTTRIINMNRLGRVLTEPLNPPLKALFVYNANPAVTIPDQQRVLKGLEREDLFTVVFEQVMTDTAAYADIILPATTFLENYDIARAYGPLAIQLGRPVVDPVGEARSNNDVFGALASRMDLLKDEEPAGELDLLIKAMDGLPPQIGSALREGRVVDAPWNGAPVQFVDVFPLDGRSEGAPVPRAPGPRGTNRFCTRISRIRRLRRIRSPLSRRPATARSARRSVNCDDPRRTRHELHDATAVASGGRRRPCAQRVGEVHAR